MSQSRALDNLAAAQTWRNLRPAEKKLWTAVARYVETGDLAHLAGTVAPRYCEQEHRAIDLPAPDAWDEADHRLLQAALHVGVALCAPRESGVWDRLTWEPARPPYRKPRP